MKKSETKMLVVPNDLVAEFEAFSKQLLIPGVDIQVSRTQVMLAALKLGLERMRELQARKGAVG